MRVLLTGGAGFIGSHICEALLAAGHQVRVLDDFSTGHRTNLPAKVEVREVDVAHPSVRREVTSFQPDVVVHHAAQVSVRLSVEDPGADAERNVVGTVRLAEAAARAGAGVFVFASSGGAIYGEQDVFPAPEDHPLRPVSPYGASKLAGEVYLDTFARLHPLRVVHLRYGNVYGPRQDPHGEAGVVAIFSRRVLAGEPLHIYGDGLQTRDYVYVGDVVRANMLVLQQTDARGPYNIGTGVETTVVDLADRISAAGGSTLAPVFDPPKAGEQRRSVLDASRATRELGWRPQVSLDEGLRTTVASFRQAEVAAIA